MNPFTEVLKRLRPGNLVIGVGLAHLHDDGAIEYFELHRADIIRFRFFASRLNDLTKTFNPDEYKRKLWVCRYLEAEYESLHGNS